MNIPQMNAQQIEAHFTEWVMEHINAALSIPGTCLSMNDFDPTSTPPNEGEAVADPELMSILLVHPTWLMTSDNENWLDSELKSLLFSQDPLDRISEWQNGIPSIEPSKWIPPQEEMLITGPFCTMSPEMMWQIIPYLDLKSASNLSQTCRYLRAVVSQQVTFRSIFKWMPSIPKILATANLLRLHSLYDLVHELGQLKCRVCGENATSVYLPTCERICQNCPVWNRRYTLVPIEAVESAFNFKVRDMRKLPLVRAPTPAHARYRHVTNPWPLPEVRFLTPIKCALERAYEVYGSMDEIVSAARWAVPEAFGDLEPDQVTDQDLIKHIVSECSATNPYAIAPGNMQMEVDLPIESFVGFASAQYPYVSKTGQTRPDFGTCRGCQEILALPWCLPPDHRKFMGIPRGVNLVTVDRFVCWQARVLRTWEDLRDNHLSHCIGAQLLMYRHWSQRTPPPVSDTD